METELIKLEATGSPSGASTNQALLAVWPANSTPSILRFALGSVGILCRTLEKSFAFSNFFRPGGVLCKPAIF